MSEWDFVVKFHNKEFELRYATVGMDFEDALAAAVKRMVIEGRPWAQDDVAEIYDEPPLGWLGNPRKRRPILTFMPPQGVKTEEEE